VGTATLQWTDPTLRSDSTATTPDPIAPDTFTVQVYDSASATPNTPIATVAEGVGTYTTGALSAGVHNFTLTATDSEGDVSVVSNSLSVTVPLTLAAPNPPVLNSAVYNP
jgi:hypothetical protein